MVWLEVRYDCEAKEGIKATFAVHCANKTITAVHENDSQISADSYKAAATSV